MAKQGGVTAWPWQAWALVCTTTVHSIMAQASMSLGTAHLLPCVHSMLPAPPAKPAQPASPCCCCSLQLAPVWPATPAGLTAAYSDPLPFTRDGLLLRHREGHYVTGAPTPLALLWKDAACSAYLLVGEGVSCSLGADRVLWCLLCPVGGGRGALVVGSTCMDAKSPVQLCDATLLLCGHTSLPTMLV